MKRLLLLMVFLATALTGFAQADVVVTNTNNQTLYVSGASVVYYISVKNNGPSQATGVQVSNPIPAGFTASWTGSNGSFGSNSLQNTIPVLAYNEEITYTLTLNIPAGFTGALTSTASVSTTSVDSNMANNQATDTDQASTTGADIVVTNTDNESYYYVGGTTMYVIKVKNNGPQVANNVRLVNAKPSGTEIASWYSSNGYSGTGNISNEIATLAVGQTITYYFTVTLPNVYTGTLANIANVTSTTNDPIPQNNTNITDYNVKAVNADVKVSVTNNQTIYTPGGTASYTVVVKNDGPLAATNVNVANTFPAGITNINWSGTNTSSGTGALSNVIASLQSGASITYTVNIQIPATFTGNLAAQFTATPANDDPNLTNNTATDTDSQISGANIVVTNTNGQATYTVGTTTTYTITVTNQGPEVATNVNVFNAMPNGVTTAIWSGNNASSGTGDLQNTIPTLAVGASVVYTFDVTIPDNYLGSLKSETVISGPTFDPFPTCANCIDVDAPSVTTNANVAVNITDGQSSYVANQTLTYTATVRNLGPSTANDVHVVVPIPSGITNFSWTGTNGSSGTNIGLNNTIPTLANAEVVTYTIVVQIPPGFSGSLATQISATSATNDPILTNNTFVDTNTQATTGADIKVVNTNNTDFFIPGANSTYTVTVTNQGPQTAYLVAPNVTFSPGVTLVGSWNGSNGSSGTTLPVTNTIAQMNVGDVVTYTITVNIPSGQTANVVSTATATLQTPSDPNFPNPSVDTDVLGQSDVEVVLSANKDAYTIGNNVEYTLTIANNGPREATNIAVESLIPAGITGFSWTGNSTTGTNIPLNDIITLASGTSMVYAITVDVPTGFSGNLVMNASATSPVGDPLPANNQDTVITPLGELDLVVTNTNLQNVYTQGGTSTYTVTVTNNGPGNASNVQVTNLIPQGITDFTWSGNGDSGTNVDLVNMIPSLANGASMVYTINLTVPASFTGNLSSTATAMTTAGDLDLSNNVATDTDVIVAGGDVAITITDGQTTYTPGTTATYNVTVSNIGTTNAANVLVSSIVPAGVNSYSWTGNNTSGTGAINNTIAMLASGQTVNYTITFFVPGTYTNNVVTQVSITSPDSNLTNNTSTDTNTPSAGADLVVTNTDLSAIYIAGQTRNYTIQITNYGPQVAQNVEVLNPVPAGIDPSTVTWTGNSTSGVGNLQNTIPTLAVGQTVTYTFTVPVPSNFPQNVNLVSEVTVTSDTVDPNPGCTQCVDVDTPTAFADLAVTKTDNRDKFLLSDNTATPPEVEYVTYLITVVNNGPSDAMNVVVQDNLPPGINNAASMVWDASNGTSGIGAINQTIPSLLAGQTITYVVSLRMPSSFNSVTGNLVNTVTVSSPTPDNILNNNSATDIDFPSNDFVTVDINKYRVDQLVRDVLINEPCVNISNFTSSTSVGFGYFHSNNSPEASFPFKEGIVIRSGQAALTQGKYDGSAISTEGSGFAAGDADLQAIGNSLPGGGAGIRDVSFVTFDFVPTANEFSFNFLFAAQEYGTFQCGYFDVFGFILTNLDTGEVKNLAVVPGTTQPVSVRTINSSVYNATCNTNAQYFAKYNSDECPTNNCGPANVASSAINMKGQTTVLKASSPVIMGDNYRIKLAVGDYSDAQYDTAVFIEAGSFNIGGPKITGTDLYADDEDFSGPNAICEGTTRIIRAATAANPDVTYEWRRNDVIMPGEDTYFIEVSEPGVYTVTFTYGSTNCSQSDFILVDFAPPPFDVDEAEDLYVCNDATPEFNLTSNKAVVLADFVEGDFDAEYYHSKEDAEAGINKIGSETPPVSITQYPGVDGETIYIKVINQFSGGYCDPIKPFKLFLTTAPTGGFVYTDDGGAPGFCIGSSTSMLPVAPGLTPGGTYTATPAGLTIVDPATGELNINTSLAGTYEVKYEFTGMGCDPYTAVTEVIVSPCIATIASHSGNVCEGTPTFNLMATDAGIGATYEWTDNSGTVFSNVQNPIAVPVPAAPGPYNYTVVATVGTSVSAPSSITLIVHPTPTASFVTNSTTICTGTAATVQITGTPGATINLTEGSISRVVILNTTGSGQFTTNTLTAATTITLVDVVTNTVPPCNFTPSPSPSIVISVGLPTATMVGFTDPVICLGTAGSFTIQGTPGAAVTYKIDGVTAPDVILPTSGQLLVTTAVQNTAGTFTYELTNIATTGASGCSNAITGETAALTVNALPTASFTTTTPTVCQNTAPTIQFTGTPNATVAYTYSDGASTVSGNAPLDGSGNFTLDTVNLPDPNLSYTFTL
ncbi:choice-of-anchor L domain-containing protein, partial [Flavobacterium sp. PLA-1-15]|uniref:choice-of-anchor L domain-containing protein n=1 Tax=Flavobacterium sp. PLA-1-15 TaxID=3380533 RepID=UPI003B762825